MRITRQQHATTNSLDEYKIFASTTSLQLQCKTYLRNGNTIKYSHRITEIFEVIAFAVQINAFQPQINNRRLFVRHPKTPYTKECEDQIKHSEKANM